MATLDLINSIKDGDNVAAGKEFAEVINTKMTAALDAKKVELGSTMVQRRADAGEEAPEAEKTEEV
jgi:hypothetical protein